MDDLVWVGYNHLAACSALVSKHFDGYYVLNYAHTGRIRWQMDNHPEQVLEAPVVWWTFPGPYFRFGYNGKQPWDHRFVSFKGSRVQTLIKDGLFDPKTRRPFASITEPDRIKIAMDELLEYLARPMYGNARAVHMLVGLLLQVREQPPVSIPDMRRTRLFLDLARRIRARLEQHWDFTREAAALSLSYPHFRRLFRQAVGQAPVQFLNTERLQQAARLLRQSDFSLDEIAARTGHAESYYFNKRFSAYFKTPPGRYRKESMIR
jgi:AraC-like DNA-binding protein